MPTYYALFTTLGLGKLATAHATGTPLVIAEFAVGDGSGAYHNPDPAQTALVNEVWRHDVNKVYVHPNHANWIVVEAFIPATDGGFFIRESGIFDGDGNLLAVAKYPLTEKPVPGSGSEKDLYVRMILEVSNTADVSQTIDLSLVLATQEYVDMRCIRPVRAASTGSLVLTGTQTVDGVVLVVDDRILVKNQAAGSGNGIYLVKADAWLRSYDADSNLEVTASMVVAVQEGTVNADSLWELSTNAPITLGTTALNFIRLFGKTGVAPGTYKSVTVDDNGHVTYGTNPTTLGGFGIVDGVNVSDVVTAATANKILKLDANSKLPASITGDASTVDGCDAGTGANNVLKLDGAGLVPLGNVPATLTGKDADTVDGAHAGTGANNVLKLDGAGLVPLGNVPATLTGKDADTVDGAHAGTGANNVLLLDAGGLAPLAAIPANLVGKNADSVDGCHAGTGANNVLRLDNTGKVPLANIPATLTGKDADTLDGHHAADFMYTSDINIANDEILDFLLSTYPTVWTVWDISSYIPAGYSYAVVAIEIQQAGPDNVNNTEVYFRPQGSAGGGQVVGANRSSYTSDQTGSMNQAIVPIGASRKIEYKFIVPPTGSSGSTVAVNFRLQGYIR